jgi:hypothetical protein
MNVCFNGLSLTWLVRNGHAWTKPMICGYMMFCYFSVTSEILQEEIKIVKGKKIKKMRLMIHNELIHYGHECMLQWFVTYLVGEKWTCLDNNNDLWIYI